ncbi:hypothetical protein QIH87_47505 [Bradyrhizobium elkanii]|uniref:hypothetical protein n=1 Tax=Bradyrhizobium elkanii TaxID=29448 RepID=UPI002714670B|nr:hypothetical protein [Bradyrhizobium elkanii]WLB09501.1 hypothetical protein QIH87_47505 [Bradyrhizobium elkanii]WLB72552.1 hypothetical protein QIH89_00820 [Bradyrhizobium elkanii]
MFDVEWLLSPAPFSGVLLYSYRSGVLRPAVLRHLREIARQMGVEVASYDAATLENMWSVPALLDELRICDLTGTKTQPLVQKLLSLAVDGPAAPTVIMAPPSSKPLRRGAKFLHIEEPRVTSANLAKVVRYLASTSDLTSLDLASRQDPLRRHLRRWIGERGHAGLPEVMQEFDHAVVHYSNPGSGEQDVGSGSFAFAGRSYLMNSLQRFLASDEAFALSQLLRALAIRKDRGARDAELVEQLLKASVRVREISCCGVPGSAGRKSASRSATVAKEVSLLWSALLLSWSLACTSTRTDPAQMPILVEFDHFCRDFKRRLQDLAADPLNGCWTRIRETFRAISIIDDIERPDPRKELLCSISRETFCRPAYPWIEKLRRTAVGAQGHRPKAASNSPFVDQESTNTELASLSDVMGQKHILQELRDRFQSGRHDRPLLLAGPDGSGKRTIGRLYAKALLCEGDRAELRPCGSCPSCTTPKVEVNFGYFEFDVSHDEGVSHVNQVIRNLRYVPITDRRVVLITKADRSSEAINAALKTLERGAEATSFILLAEDERKVEAAARSRSAVLRVRPLPEDDARALAQRWLASNQVESAVIELIVKSGRGVPGSVLKLCREVAGASASTLEQAKVLFGFSWGVQILRYWQELLNDEFQSAQAMNCLSGMTADDAIYRLRAGLRQLLAGDAICEPAFLGLEADLRELIDCLDRHPARFGQTRVALCDELARHWFDDAIIDYEHIVDVSVKTRQLLNAASE